MKLSEVDEVLVRYADIESATAISFRLNGEFSPEWVAARIQTILDTPDWLTAARQDQLVTTRMRMTISKMEDLPFTTRTAEVLVNALEKLGNRLDKRKEATEADLHKLYAFQGTVLLDSMEKYDQYMRQSLGIAEDEWNKHKEKAIRFAAAEIARHEDGYEEPEDTERELEMVYVSEEFDADDLDDKEYPELEQPRVIS